MKGLEQQMSFYDKLTENDKKIVQRLAEIEQEDAERCRHCGGEDCICCEYYLDRQKWQSPEEMFPYANADIPSMDSEEFKEWMEYNDYDDSYDIDELYHDFVQECHKELYEDTMY